MSRGKCPSLLVSRQSVLSSGSIADSSSLHVNAHIPPVISQPQVDSYRYACRVALPGISFTAIFKNQKSVCENEQRMVLVKDA